MATWSYQVKYVYDNSAGTPFITPIDITDTKQKAELRSILRVGDATYDTPTLNQVEEAITLRKEILGETPVGGIKGSVKQDVYEGGQKVGVETKGPESLYSLVKIFLA